MCGDHPSLCNGWGEYCTLSSLTGKANINYTVSSFINENKEAGRKERELLTAGILGLSSLNLGYSQCTLHPPWSQGLEFADSGTWELGVF